MNRTICMEKSPQRLSTMKKVRPNVVVVAGALRIHMGRGVAVLAVKVEAIVTAVVITVAAVAQFPEDIGNVALVV